MEDVLNVAAYISQRYFSEYSEQIDKMKLHELMYFAQRESLIQTGEPLFDAAKYGPILKEIQLTQGETSWKNSRLLENTNNLISLEDIRKDAERMKSRIQMLKKLGFI